MKQLVLATALVTGAFVGLQDLSFAHGGTYRGPGDTVPPAGGGGSGGGPGPSAPGPSGPTAPGRASTPTGPVAPGQTPGATQQNSVTGVGGDVGADLTLWSFWWEFNKEPYLNLKSKIQEGATQTGSDIFFLGRGQQEKAKDSLAPTTAQIREVIVPALKEALANETNNDIVTGSMIALAKIGDEKSESGESEFEQIIAKFLADKNQEISETAAVSLGILANQNSIPTLEALLNDTDHARKNLVKAGEVSYRTRAFAAYGLGLIGARPGTSEENKKRIVDILANGIANDDTASRDLKVACIISLGLCPIDEMTVVLEEGETMSASSCRVGQLQYLLDFLNDDSNNYLVRAHCPTALARLLEGMPAELHAEWREKLAQDLKSRADKRSKERNEVVQSAVLAMGLVGDNGDSKLSKEVRETLAAVPKDISDIQARNFAMIATAHAGGTKGEGDTDAGISEAAGFLLEQLTKGKSTIKPWAGLSIGILANRVASGGQSNATINNAAKALREQLKTESNKSRLAAYAIGAGIMQDVESKALLLDHLDKLNETEARGYVAIALGLMNAADAKDPLTEVVKESRYKPELLKQAAVALGLLGDKELVTLLVEMLGDARGLATQAAISSALGFIGDRGSINPLVEMLKNKDITDSARGFAAVALGIVADKELLPWNSKIAENLNYRASTQTLVDSQSGTGILDIL